MPAKGVYVVKDERDEKNRPVYQELSDGNWLRYEYDDEGHIIYAEDSEHGVMCDSRDPDEVLSSVDFSKKVDGKEQVRNKTVSKQTAADRLRVTYTDAYTSESDVDDTPDVT